MEVAMGAQKLSVKAFAISCSLIWSGCILTCGIANMIWAGYAQIFLDFAASIYPGYDAVPTIASVLIGTLWGLADGFVGGLIFVLIYNLIVGKCCKTA